MSCIICHNSYESEDCPDIYFTEYKDVLVCDSCISDLANIQAAGNGESTGKEREAIDLLKKVLAMWSIGSLDKWVGDNHETINECVKESIK